MKVNRYTLYTENTDTLFGAYSRAKFGDPDSIKKISHDLVLYIKNVIPAVELRKSVIYATNKSPIDSVCKKNSYLVAECVAQLLHLELWSGEYSYISTDKSFYDTAENRFVAIHKPKLIGKEGIVPFQKSVLFIDDSILSGTTLQVSLDELQSVADVVHAFFVIDLSSSSIVESDVNNYAWKDKDINFLIEIIKSTDYTYTTQMMRAIDSLLVEDRQKLVRLFSSEELEKLKQAYRMYFDKDIII